MVVPLFWNQKVVPLSLQVLPLRVLVSRQVIRDRMDYTGYLAGRTKSEMDVLDRLAGRFVVEASELTVERFWGDKKLQTDELERRRGEIPSYVNNLLDGTAEINILEETSSDEPRMWTISDVDNVQKCFELTSSCLELQPDSLYDWIHSDFFIEDGKLMAVKKGFAIMDGISFLIIEFRYSFSTDKQGNLVREFICRMPILDIKLTKVMSALRVVSSDRSSLCHCAIS